MKTLILVLVALAIAIAIIKCSEEEEPVETKGIAIAFVVDEHEIGYQDGYNKGLQRGFEIGRNEYGWIMWRDCETDRLRSDGVGITDTIHTDTTMIIVHKVVTYNIVVDTTCLRLKECETP